MTPCLCHLISSKRQNQLAAVMCHALLNKAHGLAGRKQKQTAYLRVLLPFLLRTCVTTWKDVTADPAFTAVALAAFSMVQPSAAGAGKT